MEIVQTHNSKNFETIKNLSDVQKIFKDITGQQNINIAINKLIKDYLQTKIFQLKIQNVQYETKWGLTYSEFEKKSSTWDNASSYEIEQEYYNWGEIISETNHFKKQMEQWL